MSRGPAHPNCPYAPNWPGRLACWACLGLCTACLCLCAAFHGLQGCSKCLQERPKRFPRAPRISNFAHPYSTLGTFSKIARCALQVLLDCFLAALGALLDAFWAQLGLSWVPLGLNLGPLGRLIGPTWASWNALDLHLGPLERQGAPVGAWPGLQDASWTPSGRQVGLPKRLPVSTYVLRTSKTSAKSHSTSDQQHVCRCIATGAR